MSMNAAVLNQSINQPVYLYGSSKAGLKPVCDKDYNAVTSRQSLIVCVVCLFKSGECSSSATSTFLKFIKRDIATLSP